MDNPGGHTVSNMDKVLSGVRRNFHTLLSVLFDEVVREATAQGKGNLVIKFSRRKTQGI